MRPESIKTYVEYEWHGGKVYREPAYPNINFAKDGEVYDLDGQKAIVIGGAYSVDKHYRLMTHGYWWSDEQPSKEIKAKVESKLEDLNWKVDIVLSHTCPAKYIPTEAFLPSISQDEIDHSTKEWLDTIEEKLKYNAWYCGHWHINKRIDSRATGEKIDTLLKNHKISVKELANTLGVSNQSVYKWLSGQSLPSLENLFQISHMLNVTMDEIIIGANNSSYVLPEIYVRECSDVL